jgi:inosine-uridine nucleoside N-ribohydrolase
VDISIKAMLTTELVKEIAASKTPAAAYVARFFNPGDGGDYMWDELAAAAWLDPTLITRRETRYMSVDISHGANYGNTVTWTENDKAKVSSQPVEIQLDLDQGKFYRTFVRLMTVSSSH